jgi:hypothetical protein
VFWVFYEHHPKQVPLILVHQRWVRLIQIDLAAFVQFEQLLAVLISKKARLPWRRRGVPRSARCKG